MRNIIYIAIVFPLLALAQKKENFNAKLIKFLEFGKRDTNYIKQHQKDYNIQTSGLLNSWIFYIDPPFISGKNQNINLAPNIVPQISLGLNLKYLSISASYNLPVFLNNEIEYGSTRFFDLAVNFYKGYLGSEINFNFFRGMHQSSKNGEAITIREDSRLMGVWLNTYYVQNFKKFSLRSAIKTQEIQQKSAGSFVVMLHTGLRALHADTPFVSVSDNKNTYGLINNATNINTQTIALRPGYAHNFVFKNGKYFISPAFFAGAGFSNLGIKQSNNRRRTLTTDYNMHVKFSAGYNGISYFFNVYGNYDVSSMQLQKTTSIAFNQAYMGFNLGYRFSTFIKKYDKWL